MKFLITGGAAFIGFHLAKLFISKNYQVDLTDLIDPVDMDDELIALKNHRNCNYFKYDLLNLNQENIFDNDYDFIIHLAAIVGVENVLSDSYGVLHKNFLMLSRVINIAQSQEKRTKLVFTSTSEVYAGSQYHQRIKYPTVEDTILTLPDLSSPRTSYMLSKIYGEAMCHASNLDFLILRPHNIYGPRMGMKHVIPQLLKKILLTPENGTLDVFSPNHTRTFCYVTYAAQKILDLLEKPLEKKLVLNLGVSEEEIKIKELAKILIEVCNRKDIIIKELEDTQGSPSRRVPDTSKLINSTKNTKIPSLIEGITHTYNWYKEFLK